MKKFHHIGVATNNIEKLTDEYILRGYECSGRAYDPVQKAELRLLCKKGHRNIELISTNDQKSRIFNLAHNNYKKEYHDCYQVQDISKHIEELRKKGYLQVTKIEPSTLFNGKVCFMYKNGNLIELMEAI